MRRIQISFLLCLAVSFAFSLFAQDTKELILLQTSDVHSRIEPVNQKGDRNYNEGGFVRRHPPHRRPAGGQYPPGSGKQHGR